MWVGKFIGGTLGAPIEGLKSTHSFTADLALPNGVCENDDTDLQLLWLHALEEHGIRLGSRELMAEWREHVEAPWNEYGVAAANWERGLLPPESGVVANWFFGECMGCAIRSEIWAALCPGAPAYAAQYAAQDASLDHFGNAVEAEKFLAAMEAEAFFVTDVDALIQTARTYVDPASRLAQLIGDVLQWTSEGSWLETRNRILAHYGHPEMTHVLQNVGFILLGLLYGRGNFCQTLATTLNCGYDADCTAATAGAILGAMIGFDQIPESLRNDVSDGYVLSSWMRGFPRHGSISALSQACCALGQEVAQAFETGVTIGEVEPRPPALAVQAVARPPIVPVAPAFPTWQIVGPFWRPWEERQQADIAGGEHGLPSLPSVHYFSHNQSGFDRAWLQPEQLNFDTGELPPGAQRWVRAATDDRLPLDALGGMDGPACYYASAELEADAPSRLWLLVGATGPVEVWWNGERIIHSETFQPLTPSSFPAEVEIVPGRNRIVLKLARVSQPLAACVNFKRHQGAHWHQSFIETNLRWVGPQKRGDRSAPVV